MTEPRIFTSVPDMLAYLNNDLGKSIKKSTLYSRLNKDKVIRKQADGSVLQKDLDAFAATLDNIAPSESEIGKNTKLQERKYLAEIHRIEEQGKREEIKRKREEGLLIPREEVETEMATRAVVLEDGLKSRFERDVVKIIETASGDPNKSVAVLNLLGEMVDAALNEYSQEILLEVEFVESVDESDADEA
ncbi:hypothetical protein [Halodesulfovibrio aestuarii]|uniref:Terminase small subunit n=1 Tax=Halodesulfovibrio aestuarii TaxID=126333 RepID=A0ABV4JTY6_9BACT